MFEVRVLPDLSTAKQTTFQRLHLSVNFTLPASASLKWRIIAKLKEENK